MTRMFRWVAQPANIPTLFRWSALALFLASMVLPSGLGFLGIVEWGCGLLFVQVFQTVQSMACPLAGITNFFVLFFLFDWKKSFSKTRFIIVGIGVALQFSILHIFLPSAQHQIEAIGNVPRRYLGIGYIFWIASFMVTWLGMLLKYWFVEKNQPIESFSETFSP